MSAGIRVLSEKTVDEGDQRLDTAVSGWQHLSNVGLLVTTWGQGDREGR